MRAFFMFLALAAPMVASRSGGNNRIAETKVLPPIAPAKIPQDCRPKAVRGTTPTLSADKKVKLRELLYQK